MACKLNLHERYIIYVLSQVSEGTLWQNLLEDSWSAQEVNFLLNVELFDLNPQIPLEYV